MVVLFHRLCQWQTFSSAVFFLKNNLCFISVQKCEAVYFGKYYTFHFVFIDRTSKYFWDINELYGNLKYIFFSSTCVLLLCMGGLNANIISVFQWIPNSVKVWIIHKTALVCNDIRCFIVFVVFRARFEIMNSKTWPIEWAMASFELCQLWPISTYMALNKSDLAIGQRGRKSELFVGF
jgi:hypothetical protein